MAAWKWWNRKRVLPRRWEDMLSPTGAARVRIEQPEIASKLDKLSEKIEPYEVGGYTMFGEWLHAHAGAKNLTWEEADHIHSVVFPPVWAEAFKN